MDELISRNALINEFEWLKSQVSECSKGEIEETIQRIKNAPAVDAVSRGLFEQYKWERDVAIAQLNDYGVSFGEKADCVKVVRCKDCEHSRERNEHEIKYLIDDVLICTSCDATDDCWNPVFSEHFCSCGEKSTT